MPQTHILKTYDVYWDAIQRGEKPFEIRRDDRGFQKGDTLILRRMVQNNNGSWSPDRSGDRWHDLERKITYILTGGQLGIEPGYVVMGLKK